MSEKQKMHHLNVNGTILNFNSDLSGDVLIKTDAGAFSVPGDALRALFAYAFAEPTDEMVVRGDEALIEELNKHTFALNGGDTPAQKAWRAMISAIPNLRELTTSQA